MWLLGTKTFVIENCSYFRDSVAEISGHENMLLTNLTGGDNTATSVPGLGCLFWASGNRTPSSPMKVLPESGAVRKARNVPPGSTSENDHGWCQQNQLL
jgi:hypothetical protein